MFYRNFKLENEVREPYRDKNKNLIEPLGPLSLTLVNYQGSGRFEYGHGCLVAELNLYARVRPYRCRRSYIENHTVKKRVQVGDYAAFIREARALITTIKTGD